MRPPTTLRLHEHAALVPKHGAVQRSSLRASIAEHGIHVPLDITEDNVVLDGRARLAAALELGHEQVPVRVVAPDDCVAYIVRAAIERRHLTPSQRAGLVVRYAEYEAMRTQGRARSRANLRQYGSEVATLPPRGKTRDRLAALAQTSARTVQDAISVFEHDQALFEELIAGDIEAAPAARRVKRQLRDAGLPPALPLPDGTYEVVYGDPPWQLGNPDGPYAPENHYVTLPLDEIKAIAVPAADDAILFLWAVNCLLPEALEVMAAWGFEYLTNLVWVKPSIGLGRWARNRHELLVVGRKGNLPAPDLEDLPDSVVEAKRGRHSEKPACVYELIERMYPQASKLELFARGRERPGWRFWGNEVESAEEAR
jgi:N6-adenosine-specific RNA methylase IME4/ParB-like chromosome segregation protein Spo0J